MVGYSQTMTITCKGIDKMKQLQIIKEQVVLGKEFKVYGTFDEPYFLAKDVAEWIDYSFDSKGNRDVNGMLRTVDEEEKHKNINPNNNRVSWFLTEDGLYEVLMQSRKPIAKAFKKEVKKILKDIRKYGAYVGENADQHYLAYNYNQIKHQIATLPVEELDAYVHGCIEWHKQEKTRIEKAPQAHCRKGAKWSVSESKMKVLERLHDALLERQEGYLSQAKVGFASEITPLVYELKDDIKEHCNRVNGGKLAYANREG